jgi:hypothetical protein
MAESASKKTGPGNNGKDLAMAAPSVQGLCHNTTNRIRASITTPKGICSGICASQNKDPKGQNNPGWWVTRIKSCRSFLSRMDARSTSSTAIGSERGVNPE